MGSIPVRVKEFAGTLQKPALRDLSRKSSYSVVVSTTDFESVILGSSPSKSFSTFEKGGAKNVSKQQNKKY